MALAEKGIKQRQIAAVIGHLLQQEIVDDDPKNKDDSFFKNRIEIRYDDDRDALVRNELGRTYSLQEQETRKTESNKWHKSLMVEMLVPVMVELSNEYRQGKITREELYKVSKALLYSSNKDIGRHPAKSVASDSLADYEEFLKAFAAGEKGIRDNKGKISGNVGGRG